MYTDSPIRPKNIIVFAPDHDKPGKADAREFKKEARRFMAHHSIPEENLYIINNKRTKIQMRQDVLKHIKNFPNDIDSYMFSCHGFKSGFQFGFRIKHIPQLIRAMAKRFVYVPGVHDDSLYPLVSFYACDMARNLDRDRKNDLDKFGGDGGFADEFRDELCRQGFIYCRVMAHTSAGHAFRNPNARFFEGMGSPEGGTGGFYVVHRKDGNGLWKKWVAALKTDFRFDFPYMSVPAIYQHLSPTGLK